MRGTPDDYFATLNRLLLEVEVTGPDGLAIGREEGFGRVQRAARAAKDGGNAIFFIGNGGSAGIASHLAIDFANRRGVRALALNDAAALTCLGNDFGYDSVFARQLAIHARPGDVLIAISSSGRSQSILSAVAVAQERSCLVVTFSGFAADNALRSRGQVNFYVGSTGYGLVEVAHLALCHAILDIEMGWRPDEPPGHPPPAGPR